MNSDLKPPPGTYRVDMGKDGWWYLLRDGDDLIVCRRSMKAQVLDEAHKLGLKVRH